MLTKWLRYKTKTNSNSFVSFAVDLSEEALEAARRSLDRAFSDSSRVDKIKRRESDTNENYNEEQDGSKEMDIEAGAVHSFDLSPLYVLYPIRATSNKNTQFLLSLKHKSKVASEIDA